MSSEKDTKNIIALGFVSFFNDMASDMIYPLLPYYLAIKLGAGPAGLGLVEGIAESTASILKYYSGWLSDRLKRRKIIVLIGYLFSNLLRPLIGLATMWWQVMIIRFADRVGKGVRTSPRDALLADSVSEKNRALAFGFQRSMDHFGALLGPVLAWFFMSRLSFTHENIFLISAVPGVFVILTIILFVRDKVSRIDRQKKKEIVQNYKIDQIIDSSKNENNFKSEVDSKLSKSFYIFLIIIFLFTLGNSTDAFLLLLADNKGIAAALIPILWGLLSLSKSLSSLVGGWLGDRLNRKWMVIAGWIIYSIVYAGFAFADRTIHIWILFAAYGLYFGLTEGIEKAMVADLVPEDRYGRAYGLYNLAIGIGALPASLIFGFLWQTFNSRIAFLTGSGMALVAAFMLSFLKLRKNER